MNGEAARTQAFAEIEQRLLALYRRVWHEDIENPHKVGQKIDLRRADAVLDVLRVVAEVTGSTDDDLQDALLRIGP